MVALVATPTHGIVAFVVQLARGDIILLTKIDRLKTQNKGKQLFDYEGRGYFGGGGGGSEKEKTELD